MSFTNELPQMSLFAPPCQRWKMACEFSESSQADYIPEDQITQDAVDYLKSQDDALYPEIHEACQIFQQDCLSRAELEALILVGESDAEIAEYCDLSPEVVNVYEYLFFNVRHRDTPSDWLLKHTVGPPHFTGFKDHHLRQLWAWFALHGITEVLHEVIGAYYEELQNTDASGLSVYLHPGSHVHPDLQAMIADCVTPYFPPLYQWDRVFLRYYQSILGVPISKELQIPPSQDYQTQIKVAYGVLTSGLKVTAAVWDCNLPIKESPTEEIENILQILDLQKATRI
ncbi:response regulator transcription factor [Gimesia maris]|uniref:Uncharacterized protein n=1 Tax=Gimesia maris TaxID=122 RepID=A0ABX5YM75_9PLAN|nr:hypothetical protein [Gimesia maris]EDL59801.1 hypothetical protein PM8797T_31473 [Gimesia maris DSM 8797]QEG16708.1 hypothetical protein GmarT_25750 [Gimesia maris]QGQ30133.1 hypothetical protein F1729_16585 [Gimesia maris]